MRIGPNTKVMRKAKMSFQSGQVKQVIRTYAVEVQTGDRKDLDVEAVTLKLRKAMGANCKFSVYSTMRRGMMEERCANLEGGFANELVQMTGRARGTRYLHELKITKYQNQVFCK